MAVGVVVVADVFVLGLGVCVVVVVVVADAVVLGLAVVVCC